MTTAEALAIASAVKATSKPRKPLTKHQVNTIAKRLSVGVTELNKRFTGISGTVTDMLRELERARAGVALYADAMKINLTEKMQ